MLTLPQALTKIRQQIAAGEPSAVSTVAKYGEPVGWPLAALERLVGPIEGGMPPDVLAELLANW